MWPLIIATEKLFDAIRQIKILIFNLLNVNCVPKRPAIVQRQTNHIPCIC